MKSLILFLFLTSNVLLDSQTYELSVGQDVYKPLEKSISLTNNQVWDDPDYNVPIGFNFTFFDDVIDRLYSNESDVILFTEPESTYDYVPFSAFLPFFADLIDLGFSSGESLSNISYLVEGEEGSRICIIEWSNAGFYETSYNGAGSDFVNFQLWLHEDGDLIEVHFGDSEITDFFGVFDGGGPTLGIVAGFDNNTSQFDEFLVLDGDPASPTLVSIENNASSYFYEEYILDAMPESGTIYRFNRNSVSTNEIKELSTHFYIQPNLVRNTVSLRTQLSLHSVKSVSIHNSDGALMKTIHGDYENIDIGQFASGIYNMKILTSDGLATKRFVKID